MLDCLQCDGTGTVRLDPGTQSSNEIRVTARAWVLRTTILPCGWSARRARDSDDQGVALTATTTQRRGTNTTATTPQLQRQMQRDPRPGHP